MGVRVEGYFLSVYELGVRIEVDFFRVEDLGFCISFLDWSGLGCAEFLGFWAGVEIARAFQVGD